MELKEEVLQSYRVFNFLCSELWAYSNRLLNRNEKQSLIYPNYFSEYSITTEPKFHYVVSSVLYLYELFTIILV